MAKIHARGTIHPKISTMPRTTSEASEQLELYKMVTKRQRIEQELLLMEKRMEQLNQELTELKNQIETKEKNIQIMRQLPPGSAELKKPIRRPPQPPSAAKPKTETETASESSKYETFYLEY